MDLGQIRQRARDVSAEYNPDGLVPFPFERLIDGCGDIDLVMLDSMPAHVSGAIYFEDARFTVLVNGTKPESRQYFTAAHELGHYFLHNDWLREHGDSGFVDFSNTTDSQGMLLRADQPIEVDVQKELEANNFAAELLMPEDKVRAAWKVTNDIVACAEIFLVSASAMATRLERLNLLP
ncbi:MAG TPA: ImmA/IrrE family metallo-endopeptidase [Candidatus Saccharimonadales bacterium]